MQGAAAFFRGVGTNLLLTNAADPVLYRLGCFGFIDLGVIPLYISHRGML